MPKPDRRAKRPRKEHADIDGSSRESTGHVSMNIPSASTLPAPSSKNVFHDSQNQTVSASRPSDIGHQDARSSSLPAPPGKVAIPALRPSHATESASKNPKIRRTAHACNNCRKTKAGCTGEMPCPRCRNAGIDCEYGDGKREAEKKELTRLSKETTLLSQHNKSVTDALQRLHLDTALSKEDMRAAIELVLAMNPVSSPQDKEGTISTLDTSTFEDDDQEVQDADDESDAGSIGSIDAVNIDTNREDIRPTGHIGKASSVAWAKRTAEECRRSRSNGTSTQFQENDLSLASYHTEDADIQGIDVSTIGIFEWPDLQLGHTLVRSYFEHVHNAFPIIDKLRFESWYTQATPGSTTLAEDETIWLGTLNLIFAIAAYHGHLSNSDYRGYHNDHLIFCARAKLLCMDESLLYRDARISTVCAMGLQTLYYIATVNLNRAWTICGLAIRQALTLGLYARSDADDLADDQKEHRVRVWWSLYSLECLLTELTGRPSCISDMDISTPLPINLSEDDFHPGEALYQRKDDPLAPRSSRRGSRSSKGRLRATYQVPVEQSELPSHSAGPLPVTPSTYFIYHTQLSIISHEIVTHVYCAATIKIKWSDVQTLIKRIDQRLQVWEDELPSGFNINFDTYLPPDWNDPCFIPRIGLAMLFNSARMLLFRPSLCRFQERAKQHRSEESQNFNQKAVEACILAAQRMISLLSWPTTSVGHLYTIRPWWSTLHYLCEALSVLLLEMAYRNEHMPSESAHILKDAKRGINWLSMMSAQSISARKAWEIFNKLIRQVTSLSEHDVSDMPFEAPMPPGYNWLRSSHAYGVNQNHQLPHSNLRTYQHAETRASPLKTTATWTSQPSSHQPLSENAGAFQQSSYVGNPLNHNEALSKFTILGNLHGFYDDSWIHMFGAADTDMYGISQEFGENTVGAGSQEFSVSSGAVGGAQFDPSETFNMGFQQFGSGEFEEREENFIMGDDSLRGAPIRGGDW